MKLSDRRIGKPGGDKLGLIGDCLRGVYSGICDTGVDFQAYCFGNLVAECDAVAPGPSANVIAPSGRTASKRPSRITPLGLNDCRLIACAAPTSGLPVLVDRGIAILPLSTSQRIVSLRTKLTATPAQPAPVTATS